MAETPANFEEDIDESEEEALLKSDDETDAAARLKTKKSKVVASSGPVNVDVLMQEDSQLEDYDDSNAGVSEGKGDIDDDDDEDDDDDDNDEFDETYKVLTEYKAMIEELENQKYAYDKYLRLCELSHATGDLDYIRNAYTLFSAVYPLSPELWLKFISIEASVALSPKEIKQLEELFRRALRDYYSTEVAVQFAAFALRTSDPEHIWREILGTYGLDCMKGQQFFKLYRQYISTHTTMSSEEKQAAYIQSFVQELNYPLNNMEESYIEFKVFYEKNRTEISPEIDWELLDKDYFKAKEHLLKIIPFEEKLQELQKTQYRERAAVYTSYIKDSDKFLDENVLQIVYERMVAECCLNAECWLTYIEFIDYRDEFGRPKDLQDLPAFQQTALDINNRALRNCTWSEKLYIKRIQLLEDLEKSREVIQEVLESSLSAGFDTAEPVVAIWLEYLTYLRRHTNWEDEAECEILRKNFNLCWTILGQQWGVLADCNCEILQFWGRLEYGPLQDPKRGKQLWTTVMDSSDNATKSGLWIEFAHMETRRDFESTRRLFRKALHTPNLDNPFVIASAWQRFERCNGTIKTLKTSIEECEKFLEHLLTSASSIGSTVKSAKGTKRKISSTVSTEVSADKKSKPNDEIKEQITASTLVSTTVPAPAPKASSVTMKKHTETAFKEHENQEIDLTKDHLRIFLSNLDYNLNEDDIRSGLPEIKITSLNLIRSINGKSRGFGYLELESSAEVEKALTLDRRSLNGRPIFISSVLRDKEKRQKFKYSDGLEPKKLFLKSLAQDTTKEELEKIYSAFGKLKDIRLVYHKSGKFKNIAYIEFENEKDAGKALMSTDQMELRGHTVSVSISAPPPKPSEQSINSSKTLGLNTKRVKLFDQKPRMSLIPTVVRKKLDVKRTYPLTTPTTASQIRGENGATTKKTNEDFRKLLQKS